MGPARTRVRLRLDSHLRWEDGRAPTLRAVYQAKNKLVPTELESVIRVALAEAIVA